METLANLPTEAINPATVNLSRVPTYDALLLINNEDQKVALAVRQNIDVIAAAVDAIAERMQKGGRLFYVGAGTSGRLGVVDASECPPTFGTPPEWVQGIIAGGKEAMFRSQEGTEDDPAAGAEELRRCNVTAEDCVIGIAASGRTPFVLGALEYANSIKAFTGGITVNPDAPLKTLCDYFIAPEVGPEAVTGSTRMKAGTAQKLVLNMISTGVMLRLGRVEGNLMSDVQQWCGKLQDRAVRIVMELAKVDAKTAAKAISENNGDVRKATAAAQKYF